nr:hypothetical protein [Tanacetum cinerariifolium]
MVVTGWQRRDYDDVGGVVVLMKTGGWCGVETDCGVEVVAAAGVRWVATAVVVVAVAARG